MQDAKPETMWIEGESAKPFVVYWTDINNQPYEQDGEYDTIQETLTHKRRGDRRYGVYVRRKFMHWPDFEEWAKTQK